MKDENREEELIKEMRKMLEEVKLLFPLSKEPVMMGFAVERSFNRGYKQGKEQAKQDEIKFLENLRKHEKDNDFDYLIYERLAKLKEKK